MRKKKDSRDYLFGNRLMKLRKQNRLTQFQLGRLIGVSDKAVSKWENGSAKPSTDSCTKLAEVLHVTVDEILRGGEGEGTAAEDDRYVKEYTELFGPRDLYAGHLTDLVSQIWNRLPIHACVEAACDETIEYMLSGSSLSTQSIQDYGHVSVCWMQKGQRYRIMESVTGLEPGEIVSKICIKVSESMKLGLNKTDSFVYLDENLIEGREPLTEEDIIALIRKEGTKLQIICRKMVRMDENGNQTEHRGECRKVVHEHALYYENGKMKSFYVDTENI
ncbi:MAG: helix-turn-helix transcriptional regulator [Clostridia bacterium]|nr:helix-turn-helix transcriptional regulator [Clostridia bacterium]